MDQGDGEMERNKQIVDLETIVKQLGICLEHFEEWKNEHLSQEAKQEKAS
jgi:hypothetical protein